MNTGYETKIYPTEQQARVLAEWFGSTRAVKNLAIEQRRSYWDRNKRLPTDQREPCTYKTQCADLKLLRNDPVIAPWLKHTPMQVLQQALKDVDTAYERYYTGVSEKPTYRSKYKSKKSARVPQGFTITRSSKKWGKLKLPLIEKSFKFRYKRGRGKQCLKGTVKSITISQDAVGDYYISFQCETNEHGKSARLRRKKNRERERDCLENLLNGNTDQSVGLDLGVAQHTVTSTGLVFLAEALTPMEHERLKNLQAQEARQVKGSNRRKNTRKKINRLYRLGMRRRVEHARQVVAYLRKHYDHVCLEDLKLVNMTKSAKGTIEEPGKNVAQKRGLNRSLLDQALGFFIQELTRVFESTGGIITKSPAAYSSQDCSQCEHRCKDNREERDYFKCVSCGFAADADVNAALNLLARGLKTLLQELDYTPEQAQDLLNKWKISTYPDKLHKLNGYACNQSRNVLNQVQSRSVANRETRLNQIQSENFSSDQFTRSMEPSVLSEIDNDQLVLREAGAVFQTDDPGPDLITGSRSSVKQEGNSISTSTSDTIANTRLSELEAPDESLARTVNHVSDPGKKLVSPLGTFSKQGASTCGSIKTRHAVEGSQSITKY